MACMLLTDSEDAKIQMNIHSGFMQKGAGWRPSLNDFHP